MNFSRPYMSPDRMRGMFSCEPGWHSLIEEFVTSVDEMMSQDDNPLGLSPWKDFRVLQVKQKWGTLTIYYTGEPEHRKQDLISLVYGLAERSESMCEECGKVFDKPHMNARCSDECEETRLERRQRLVMARKESKKK